MSKDKRPICTCPVYKFPHHRDHFCRLEEDGSDPDGANELREQDNRDRARDCQAEADKGKFL